MRVKNLQIGLSINGSLQVYDYFPSPQPYVVADGVVLRRGELFASVMSFLLAKQEGPFPVEYLDVNYVTPEGQEIKGSFTRAGEGEILQWAGNGLPPAPELLISIVKRLKFAPVLNSLASDSKK